MRKEVSFRVNNSGELTPGLDIDPKNGFDGEYLDILRINDMDLLFTRIINSVNTYGDEKSIRVNEIAYDIEDGNTRIFYNTNKKEDIKKLQSVLNDSPFDKDMNIKDVLKNIDIDYSESPIKDVIESCFRIMKDHIYPYNYDYKKEMDEVYGAADHENMVVEIPMNSITITGVPKEVFLECTSITREDDYEYVIGR
jgi:hypothetical protein